MRAAIDVGTNTVRLLIGEVRDERILPERYCRRITRLGGKVTAGKLAPEAMERTLAVLQEFADLLAEENIQQVRAVGTEVLRRAGNAGDFTRQVERSTGIFLEVIDGEQEARLTACGVLSGLDPRPQACLIFDVGGGSTEFILWHAGKMLLQRSYPLGVVRLAEDFADTASQSARIEQVVRQFRAEVEEEGLLPLLLSPGCRLVGTAGTVTTLGALYLQMAEYDGRRINSLALQKVWLLAQRTLLEPLSGAEREKLPGMEKGRGDLIVPGLHIVLAILDRFHFDHLTVSDCGLIEGILLDQQ